MKTTPSPIFFRFLTLLSMVLAFWGCQKSAQAHYAYQYLDSLGCPRIGFAASINDAGQAVWWGGWDGFNWVGFGDASGRHYQYYLYTSSDTPVINNVGQIAFITGSPGLVIRAWPELNSFTTLVSSSTVQDPHYYNPVSIDNSGSV